MPTLPDGTVIPSFMDVSDTTWSSIPGYLFDNNSIRPGEITQVFYPGDDGNVSGKNIEYIVAVDYRDSNGALTRVPYRCVVADSFGGIADFCRYTLRPSSDPQKTSGDGSRVLVCWPNGDSSQGTIIGGLRNPNVSDDNIKRVDGDNGSEGLRSLAFLFNGVAVEINDDGEFKITASGPTKVDGDLADNKDDNQKGCFVKFEKNGQITVSNNRSDDGESIVISTEDKKISIKSDTCETKTTGDWSVDSGGDINVKASGDVTVESGGTVVVKADTIKVGSGQADQNMVLGNKLTEALNGLVDIFLNNAGNLGVGNLGFPVVLFPSIIAQLIAWKIQHTTGAGPVPAQVLSRKSFVE